MVIHRVPGKADLRLIRAAALCLLAPLLMGAGRVDPQWLAHWNEAVRQKPTSISEVGRIAPIDEAGTPLVIHGQVLNPDLSPASGVIVHGTHRDAEGYDFRSGDTKLPTWRLQGWAKTDGAGQFTFHTIRPAADYLGREPAHFHFTLVSDTAGRQWAPKIMLADDPIVSEQMKERSAESGQFATLARPDVKDGVQHISITLPLKPAGDF